MSPEISFPQDFTMHEKSGRRVTWASLPGYRIYWDWHERVPASLIPPGATADDIHRLITLKNRSFRNLTRDFDDNVDKSVDELLEYLLSDEIESRIANGRVPISILDIGGGYRSTSAGEIAKEFGEAVSVTNLELFHEVRPSDRRRVNVVLGDVLNPPIPDMSQDLIYSCFVFKYLNPNSQQDALKSVVRLLKPDGIAILHGPLIAGLSPDGPAMKLNEELIGARIHTQDGIAVLRRQVPDLLSEVADHYQQLSLGLV